jgi:hypothetical protein
MTELFGSVNAEFAVLVTYTNSPGDWRHNEDCALVTRLVALYRAESGTLTD